MKRCPAVRRACEHLEPRRLMNAGDPDAAFSGDGYASLVFPGSNFLIRDVAVQSSGKTIVVGSRGSNFAVARLNVDGMLDTSFGLGGLTESAYRPDISAVAIQSDDKIVVGLTGNELEYDNSVARLNANGGIDTTFGTNGYSPFLDRSIREIAVQQDGKILAAGGSFGDGDFSLARLNTNGTLDSSFDGDGKMRIGFGEAEEAFAMAIDYSGTPGTNPRYGTIVLAGTKGPGGAALPNRFAVARVLPNGVLDNSFDGDGKLSAPDLSDQSIEAASGMYIQSGGYIVVSGTARTLSGPGQGGNLLAARFAPGGALDTTFGPANTGVVETDLGGDDRATDLAMNALGGFVLAGRRGNSSGVLVAYTQGGSLDNRFGSGGVANISLSGNDELRLATTINSVSPVRRILVSGLLAVGRFIDVGPLPAIFAGITDTAESTARVINVILAQAIALPYNNRVYINLGGSATPPGFVNPFNWDYSIGGTFHVADLGDQRNYIDIPAGQTLVTFTVTPINDTRLEADESILLSIAPNPAYDAGNPASVQLVIRDNDRGPNVSQSTFLFETAPQRAQFRFDQYVGTSIDAGDFTVAGPGGAVPFTLTYDSSYPNTATLTFATPLPDGIYTATALAAGVSNETGLPMAANASLNFHVLAGDLNRDRTVNFDDLLTLAQNYGQTGRTFSQGNIDYSADGLVGFDDLLMLAQRYGTSLVGISVSQRAGRDRERGLVLEEGLAELC